MWQEWPTRKARNKAFFAGVNSDSKDDTNQRR